MSAVTVARNYAEALFELGERSGQLELYADLLDAVAAAIDNTPEVQAMLASPRVTRAEKARILGAALGDAAPREFVLFLQAVVKRGRQLLLGHILREYLALVDVKHNRVRAAVTVARQPDEALRATIEAGLGRALGKTVIADFRVDPAILGGAVVRVGERVYDGSVRRRLARLRRTLLAG
jgi:F-type H+-transporting ATPase subunit delta